MKDNNQGGVTREQALSRAFRDSILDASEDELQEALEHEGHDRNELVRLGRMAINRVLARVSVDTLGGACKYPEPAEVEDLHKGLGACIQLLRRKKRISYEELAEKARVPVEEVRRIECDLMFTPKPRTLARLEDFFGLNPKSLGVLSGAIRVQEGCDEFRQEVKRFAAMSSGMGKLSREEQRLLADFFKIIDEYTD